VNRSQFPGPLPFTKDSLAADVYIRDKPRDGREQGVTFIFTIGYEGSSIGTFADHLLSQNISILADVRAVPLSRKPGFSKKALSQTLKDSGIEYRHYLDLGDPKHGREAARAGKYNRFREIFEAHLDTARARRCLDEVAAAAASARVCLMCFERSPENCHRSLIAARLADRGMVVIHLHDPNSDSSSREARPRRRYHQSGASAQ
jgi:uncharacterized protein (DUF488 family)